MDITDVQLGKEIMEQHILKIIQEFEWKTKTEVRYIDIERAPNPDRPYRVVIGLGL